MNKFQNFLNNLKLKIKKITPIQWIAIVIVIILFIWYIITLFSSNPPDKPKKPLGPLCNITGNDPTTRCDYGQICHDECKPNPICSTTCGSDQKFYCDLNKCDIDCGTDEYPYVNTSCGLTDSKDVKCIKPPNGELTDNGQEYQTLVKGNGDDCNWLNGFTKDVCKLTNSDSNSGILYGDCIDNLNSAPYSFNNKLNDSFKCGYPQGTETNNPSKWVPQGQDGLLQKDPSATLNVDIFNSCSAPTVKSGFANITNWDTIGNISSKKLLGSNGSTGKTQNTNPFCGTYIQENTILGYKQIIDCSQGGTVDNESWKNYYTSLHCQNDGTNIGTDLCEVPCWMFDTINTSATGQGSICTADTPKCTISGGFPPECKWSLDDCSPYDYSYELFAQSCNYDLNGCTTKLGSDGSVLVPTINGSNCTYTDGSSIPVDISKKGCRPIGDNSIMNGLYCSKSGGIYNYITSIDKYNIIYDESGYTTDSIVFTVSNPTPGKTNEDYATFMNILYFKLLNPNTTIELTPLIYLIKENNIDLSNQIYITFNSSDTKITTNDSFDPNKPPDTLSITLSTVSKDILITYPQTTHGIPNNANFVALSSIKGNNSYFVGLSLKIGNKGSTAFTITLNSVEFGNKDKLNVVDLSNSKNIINYPQK